MHGDLERGSVSLPSLPHWSRAGLEEVLKGHEGADLRCSKFDLGLQRHIAVTMVRSAVPSSSSSVVPSARTLLPQAHRVIKLPTGSVITRCSLRSISRQISGMRCHHPVFALDEQAPARTRPGRYRLPGNVSCFVDEVVWSSPLCACAAQHEGSDDSGISSWNHSTLDYILRRSRCHLLHHYTKTMDAPSGFERCCSSSITFPVGILVVQDALHHLLQSSRDVLNIFLSVWVYHEYVAEQPVIRGPHNKWFIDLVGGICPSICSFPGML